MVGDCCRYSFLQARAHREGQRSDLLRDELCTLLPAVVPNLMVTGGQLAFLDFRVELIHQTGHRQLLDMKAAFCSLILPKYVH